MEKVNERTEMLSWAVFVGSMFVGMGIGMIFDQSGTGMFIGLGVGFIASAIIERFGKVDSN